MKTIKLITLLVLAIMCSCTQPDRCSNCSVPFYDYQLFLRILDASGNNLVQEMELDWTHPDQAEILGRIKTDLYTLDIVFPEPCMDIYEYHKHSGAYEPAEFVPILSLNIHDYYYYLALRTQSMILDWCPNPAEMLTFKLSCPDVFGDNAVHEIVTYWKEGNKPTNSRICYRIELDGIAFTEEITYEQYNQISRATVILESR